MISTLIIKRYYFDQIVSGQKKREYRSDSPFYKKTLLNPKLKYLMLHYYRSERAIVEVISAKVIPCPAELKDIGIPFTKNVIQIDLGSVFVKRI